MKKYNIYSFLKKELHENIGDHRKILAGSNFSFSPFWKYQTGSPK
jgi:hypothetical protein